jgi:hypothetical protein
LTINQLKLVISRNRRFDEGNKHTTANLAAPEEIRQNPTRILGA